MRVRIPSFLLNPTDLSDVNFQALLHDLEWITPQRRRQLDRFGLTTVETLLTHFPHRYEDRSKFDRFPTAETEQPVCLCGIVKKAGVRHLRNNQRMFDAVLEEENAHALSPPLVCRWFNAHWVEKAIATGQRLVVYGKPKKSGANIVIAHPEFEVVDEESEGSIHLQRIVPIHRATEGLSTRVLRQMIWDALDRLDPASVTALLPAGFDPIPRVEALKQIHFPDSAGSLESARRHLVLIEFFGLQLCVAAKRAEQIAQPGEAHCGSGRLMEQLHAALPFALTNAQNRAIAEIRADLGSQRSMNRLLHGDVGSGKTLVALSAMLLTVEAGYQAALMAPTQILAEQHYLTFKRLLDPLGIGIALRTGARKEETTALPLFAHAGVQDGAVGLNASASAEPQIFIGTHALLYESAGISRLGLAVIDEQHKFGVMQRARLRDQGIAPDVLVMTATPIPRTLTMTVYGDLDVSTLDELPANRGKIITGARPDSKLPDAVKFIREHLEAGRQAYVVYPLIDGSEKLEAKAAAAEFEKWRQFLAPMQCELLHGRIPPEEKEAIMERFRRGESKALIATTVIEVGIDVPNATIMLIENAERFGLAQLHQLRGRIGRGVHKSYCILLSSKTEDPEAQEKLRILAETRDGFEIAEADLRLRGPGDLLGTAQSGLPPLKLGNLFADAPLMRLARQRAIDIFDADPALAFPENGWLSALLAGNKKISLSQVS
ncbi:MAG: ATP-dependent helicase RecG [Chthoniobacteraceae bacterium]|nr:ATP-dependent helicase RecG [Chthoniobacteraceae bacterium]